jgi:hypothetical protein
MVDQLGRDPRILQRLLDLRRVLGVDLLWVEALTERSGRSRCPPPSWLPERRRSGFSYFSNKRASGRKDKCKIDQYRGDTIHGTGRTRSGLGQNGRKIRVSGWIARHGLAQGTAGPRSGRGVQSQWISTSWSLRGWRWDAWTAAAGGSYLAVRQNQASVASESRQTGDTSDRSPASLASPGAPGAPVTESEGVISPEPRHQRVRPARLSRRRRSAGLHRCRARRPARHGLLHARPIAHRCRRIAAGTPQPAQ